MCKDQNHKPIPPAEIEEILSPYWVQLLRRSTLSREKDGIILRSHLGATQPWYCDLTGHMNAVEFNLIFNQMMYIAIGQSIDWGWIPELEGYDKNYFMKKYWPDFLITKISSQFKAPLDVSSLYGTMRIKAIKKSSRHIFFELDLTAKPAEGEFPKPGEISHAYATMNLVIKDYQVIPEEDKQVHALRAS